MSGTLERNRRRSIVSASVALVAVSLGGLAACRTRGELGTTSDAGAEAQEREASTTSGSTLADARSPDVPLAARLRGAADPASVARALASERGESVLVGMLVGDDVTDDRAWNAAASVLSPDGSASLRSALVASLEPGKSSAGVRRAVVTVDVHALPPLPLATRIRELAQEPRASRAAAVLLRALASRDAASAAAVGCEVLAGPLAQPNDRDRGEPVDRLGRDVFVEAAVLAVAHGGAPGDAATCDVGARLGSDLCLAMFRCDADGPLSGREPSRQDEPLCSASQLHDAMTKELARTPADVVAATGGTRTELFAFARLTDDGRLPQALRTAHARRRYALAQPEAPACDVGLEPGKPCHCDEAMVRDHACRQSSPGPTRVGVCGFTIDDKTKKLTGVAASSTF